jgi:hypothetical protein
MLFTINLKIKMSGPLSTTSNYFTVFISMLPLPEGQMGEAWEPSNIRTLFLPGNKAIFYLGLRRNIELVDLEFKSPDRTGQQRSRGHIIT